MKVTRVEIDAPEVAIVPFGDAQVGVPAFDLKAAEEFLAEAPKGALHIGMGDYVDGVSPSNRKLLRAMRADERLYDIVWSMLDSAAYAHYLEARTLMSKSRGPWLGLVEGHHYWVFGTKGEVEDQAVAGKTTDEALATDLDAEFYGHSAIIDIVYGDGIERRIRVVHGETGAATETGAINSMKKELWTDADVILQGHTHRKFAVPTTPRVGSLGDSESGWQQKETWLISTGSFLRGYMKDHETYVEKKNLPPTHLGGVQFKFDKKGRTRVNL